MSRSEAIEKAAGALVDACGHLFLIGAEEDTDEENAARCLIEDSAAALRAALAQPPGPATGGDGGTPGSGQAGYGGHHPVNAPSAGAPHDHPSPGPAPSMEEIEMLVSEFDTAEASFYTATPGGKWETECEARANEAEAALLSAIRALPDRYAEGWVAGREAAARSCVARGDSLSPYGQAASEAFRCADRIRSLPTPNPEDRRTQDHERKT